ncbi:MAG: lipopolysaccharide transport periplasmic protein LptA [Betaproteobacteria bacterium]|jgi:lipopolysaccharide export system protein LptA
MTTSTRTLGPMRHGAARAARLATLVCAAVLSAHALPAAAERADRDKPTLVEANQCVTEELKQISVCTGNVVLTRGTMRITGERMELKQDPEGYRQASVDAAPGQLALFRQRQDSTSPGIEEFVEGVAERIEYDERTENVRLVRRALWKRLENERPRDEVAGDLITYDGRSETYRVTGGKDAGPDGRVKLILGPQSDGKTPVKPAPPAPLKPAATLAPQAPRK